MAKGLRMSLTTTAEVALIKVSVDDIKAANDISPAVVAGGISIALLTTLFGLVVAIIIQTFQNFLITRVDKLVIDMEENSVMLIEELVELDSEGKLKK